MTYSIPRRTAIKGNVTITSAKRGLNKRDALCSTCIESTDSIQKSCDACEGRRIPAPMVTLAGFGGGINGTYMFTMVGQGHRTFSIPFTNVTGAGEVCVLSKNFIYSGNDVTDHPTNRGRFTIDAQWPLKAEYNPGNDSSVLNGISGLRCRNIEYTYQGQFVCRECGPFDYATPSGLAANLSMNVYVHAKPLKVEMGARLLWYRTSSYPYIRSVFAGGIWDYNGGTPVQVSSGRVFELPAGITFIVHLRNNEILNPRAVLPGYDKGWFRSPVGDQPNACAVYHAPLPFSTTATDEFGDPVLQCFGKNLNLSLVAKSQQSDAILRNYGYVVSAKYNLDGERVFGNCRGMPPQTPPFMPQTPTDFRQINDFGTTGSVTLSTSEAIIDIFLGDDFAAEMEADASCTVTDG